MLTTPAIIIMLIAVALLLASGWWTDRTYRRFDQIPAHYDIRGKATRLTSRRQMAWAIPAGFSLFLVGFAAIVHFVPADMQNGDPAMSLISASLIMLAAQGLVLWLLHRWAGQQQ